MATVLTAKPQQSIVPVVDPIAPLAYEVRFECRESNPDLFPKVAMPSITPKSGTSPVEVAIDCRTLGAAIYYTTDGSYPSAVNKAATLYSTPFQVASAKKVRAVGSLPGYLD